jgi:hypothetical protein
MKFLLKSFVLALALGATSSAFANPVNAALSDFLSDITVFSPAPLAVSGSNAFCDLFPARCEGKEAYPDKEPEPVPELNAAAAPISAAIALSAIALGAERRRRKLKIQRNA